MQVSILSFFIGILFCHTLAALPNFHWLLASGILFGLIWILAYWPTFASALNKKITVFFRLSVKLGFFFILGCIWLSWRADLILSQYLPSELEGKNLTIVGQVYGFPKQGKQAWRFDFIPQTISYQGVQQKFTLPRIRLSWFGKYHRHLQPDALCTLVVRLKKPHTSLNFGTRDYSRYLFLRQIRAKGYVRTKQNQSCEENPKFTINKLRFNIANSIKQTLRNHPSTGMIIGLAIGEKQWIMPEQWDVLRKTGILHLMVISGLHIGLVAGFGFLIGRFIWKYLGTLPLWIPSQRAGLLLGLGMASFYALLAGFLVPTKRALMMLTIAAMNFFLYRLVSVSQILIIALLLILLWNPFEIMSLGLWLSFSTVALIIYVVNQSHANYKLNNEKKNFSKLEFLTHIGTNFGKVQWAVIIGMTPVLLFVMGYFPLTSFVANAIAIPWISLVIIPLIFIGVGLLYIFPSLGSKLLELTAHLLEGLWFSMNWLAEQSWGIYEGAIPPFWAFILAVIGVLIFLLPKGFPARWIGLFWLLPLFFFSRDILQKGEIWFTLLDVGQGLSSVVRTQNYTLIYDTGPRAKTPAVPFLKSLGINQVDKLIVSHANRDHSHGTLHLIQQLKVNQLMSSQPESFLDYPISGFDGCQTQQVWYWDEVKFEILHPEPAFQGNSNDMSCVLKVTAKGGSILLTGDIGKRIEFNLLKHSPEKLPTDILIVPHHGSKNSSTDKFIKTTHPKVALFSSGYRNGFNHPHPDAVQRYQKYNINLLNTSETGAIQFKVTEKGVAEPILAKQVRKHYWQEN